MIQVTDCLVGRNTYVSYQLKYIKKSRKLDNIIKTIKETDHIFRQILNVPKNVIYRIARIKGNYHGRYLVDFNVVEIDVRCDNVLLTIAHELIHAEQHLEGRLHYEKGTPYWKGYQYGKIPKNYNAYRALPWEEEAFRRQKDVADQVVRILG